MPAVDVIEHAQPPRRRSRPKLLVNLVLGCVLGLVVGGFLFDRLGSGVFGLSATLGGLAFFSSILLRTDEKPSTSPT